MFDDLPDAPKSPKRRPSANDSEFARLVSGKPREMGVMDAVKRELGLGGRAAIRGIYDLTALAGGDLLNYAEQKIRGVPVRSQRQNADWLADKLGLPYPETATERVGGDVTGALVGGGGLLGLGKTLAARSPGLLGSVGEMMSQAPTTQLVGAASGSGASSTAREMGAGTGMQITAGLLGGLAPTAATSGSAMAVRGALRGGEAGRQRVEQNINDFAAVGTTPTAAQASESPATRGIEWFLSRLPGSANVILKRAEQQQQEIGQGTANLAGGLSGKRSAADAGRAIERGVREDFIPRTRAVEDQLYGLLDQHIPGSSRVPVANTQQAFGAVNQGVPGAPALSQAFRNERIGRLEDSFMRDASPAPSSLLQTALPGLPFEAVKKVRT